MSTELFYGNTFVLFLIFAISIFTIDRLSEKQKISIIYLCSYGVAFMESVPETILLPLMSLVLFLLQEYFTFDRKKTKILYKIHYKIADFLYMAIFQYKMWLVVVAICVRTTRMKVMLNCNENILDVMSIIMFVFAFVWIYSLTEEFYSFTEMYDVVWRTPYYGVKFDLELKLRLDIIIGFEDILFWERSKTYSWCSFEFIKTWIRNRKKTRAHLVAQKNTSKGTLVKQIIMSPITFCHWLKKILTRGHSTLPMQLIRILAYKHGLVFESTKCRFKYYKIIKRKLYEILYARMFFEGLKKYLIIELCNDLDHYREYLVYLYPQIVQTKIEGKVYAPARKAFATDKEGKSVPEMNKWDISKVIKMGFGFNGLSITEKRMTEKKELLSKFNYHE